MEAGWRQPAPAGATPDWMERPLRAADHPQHRPRQSIHQRRLHRVLAPARHPDQHGRAGLLAGQRLRRTTLALPQVRSGLPARLRLRLARDDPDRPLPHLLQQPPSPQPIERPNPPTKPTAPPSHCLALPNHSPVASRYLPRLRLYRKTGPLLPRDRSMATALRRESRSPLGR